MLTKTVKESPPKLTPSASNRGPLGAEQPSMQRTLKPRGPSATRHQAHAGCRAHLFSPFLGNLSLVVHITLIPEYHLFDICRSMLGGEVDRGGERSDGTTGQYTVCPEISVVGQDC